MDSKVIVITGASSGIGEATALRLAKANHKLVLGARREERLQELVDKIVNAGGEAVYEITDVTDIHSVEQLAEKAMNQYGRIDVWMNNAGLMPHSPLIQDRVEDWNRMIDVNLRGVLHGIHAALPIMREQKSGQFINTASVAAHAVHAGGGVYSATKAGVTMISEALRQEEAAAGSNIRVTAISPAATATEIADHITDEATRERVAKAHAKLAVPADRIAEAIESAINMPADTAINEIIVRPTAQA